VAPPCGIANIVEQYQPTFERPIPEYAKIHRAFHSPCLEYMDHFTADLQNSTTVHLSNFLDMGVVVFEYSYSLFSNTPFPEYLILSE
jgi:hypothetical protein